MPTCSYGVVVCFWAFFFPLAVFPCCRKTKCASCVVGPRSWSLVSRTARRQMDSLVSSRQDISSLLPEPTSCAKHKVGSAAGTGWCPRATVPPAPSHVNHTCPPLLGFKRPVLLRQTGARGWELLLQSRVLRAPGVGPAQRPSFTEVSRQSSLPILTATHGPSYSHSLSPARPACLLAFVFRFKETVFQTRKEFSSAGFDEDAFIHHLNTVNMYFTVTPLIGSRPGTQR